MEKRHEEELKGLRDKDRVAELEQLFVEVSPTL